MILIHQSFENSFSCSDGINKPLIPLSAKPYLGRFSEDSPTSQVNSHRINPDQGPFLTRTVEYNAYFIEFY